MKRRDFLLLTSLGMGTLSIPSIVFPSKHGNSGIEAGSGSITNVLFSIFTDPTSAIIVGRRYLALYPDRNHFEFLLRDAGLDFRADLNNHSLLVEGIVRRHQYDFEDSNTVLVNNWVLSRTEASLCGIMALS